MDLAPMDAPGWWRCPGCHIEINEHTHLAYDTQGRQVAGLGQGA